MHTDGNRTGMAAKADELWFLCGQVNYTASVTTTANATKELIHLKPPPSGIGTRTRHVSDLLLF